MRINYIQDVYYKSDEYTLEYENSESVGGMVSFWSYKFVDYRGNIDHSFTKFVDNPISYQVVSVTLSNLEIRMLRESFTNLPQIRNGSKEITYYGDHAKFIIGNLKEVLVDE